MSNTNLQNYVHSYEQVTAFLSNRGRLGDGSGICYCMFLLSYSFLSLEILGFKGRGSSHRYSIFLTLRWAFLDVDVVSKLYFSNVQICINVLSVCMLVFWVEVLIAFLALLISTVKDLDVIATHLRHWRTYVRGQLLLKHVFQDKWVTFETIANALFPKKEILCLYELEGIRRRWTLDRDLSVDFYKLSTQNLDLIMFI